MKIIINDKNLGIDIMEIVDIPNVNKHFKNLSSEQWQKLKSILMVLRCLTITVQVFINGLIKPNLCQAARH
jgi:hypothetical protein